MSFGTEPATVDDVRKEKNMRTVEDDYNDYKKSVKEIQIDDVTYYKVVSKETYNFKELGPVMAIVLPGNLFKNNPGKTIEDDNGNRFELIGPESMRFNEEIPEWYMKCWAFMIKGITDKSQIGEYVTLVKG